MAANARQETDSPVTFDTVMNVAGQWILQLRRRRAALPVSRTCRRIALSELRRRSGTPRLARTKAMYTSPSFCKKIQRCSKQHRLWPENIEEKSAYGHVETYVCMRENCPRWSWTKPASVGALIDARRDGQPKNVPPACQRKKDLEIFSPNHLEIFGEFTPLC